MNSEDMKRPIKQAHPSVGSFAPSQSPPPTTSTALPPSSPPPIRPATHLITSSQPHVQSPPPPPLSSSPASSAPSSASSASSAPSPASSTWNPSAPAHPLIQGYLRDLTKKLKWVSKDKKVSFCLEVRGHLEEIASSIEGDDPTRYYQAIRRFGDPDLIAGQFVEAYGYGRKYLIVMSLAGFLLALLTIPLRIPFVPELSAICMGLPVLMTIIVFYLIIRVSVRAGQRTGFVVGLSSGISRLIALGILLAIIASNPDLDDKIAVPGGVIAGILLVSILMVISGYLPGRVLQKYQDK